MFHRDDDRGLTLVEQQIGRRLDPDESEEAALQEYADRLAARAAYWAKLLDEEN